MKRTLVMHREEKAVLVALLLCAVSLMGLCVITTSDGPAGQAHAAALQPGQTAMVNGEVLDVHPTRTGGHLTLKVLTHDGVVGVFVPRSAGAQVVAGAVRLGDRVQVTGRVELYQGEPELVVDSAEDVVVVG